MMVRCVLFYLGGVALSCGLGGHVLVLLLCFVSVSDMGS